MGVLATAGREVARLVNTRTSRPLAVLTIDFPAATSVVGPPIGLVGVMTLSPGQMKDFKAEGLL